MITVLSLWRLWRYYAFSKDALRGCGEGILRHNARSILIISLASAVLLALFSAVSLFIEKKTDKVLAALGVGIIELAVFLHAGWLYKRKRYTRFQVYPEFGVFFVSLMGFGIYIGIITRPEYHAVNFLLFLIGSQVLFIFDPLGNFLLNLAAVSVFSFLTISFKPGVIGLSDVINVAVASFIGMALSWYLAHAIIKEMLASRRLEIERNRFREQSIRDELTGLSNRRDYQNTVNFYISVCHHVHQTVCAIMMDVDYFKNYNDFYGHQMGDMVLKSLGEVLNRLISEERVFAARVGGEEFIILWTENRIAELERVALKLRQMIIDLRISHEKSQAAPYITASFGMYILRGGSTDNPEELYHQADLALYEAKKRGRNCIVCVDSEDKTPRMVELLPPEKNLGRR
ncbi:MAG: GGDEF domain-containing protein [Treponema sp.]|jgi:diguanylate cyclase (GGDEF)-like protein|nr:GGDEF domain-containing protein [Treponema sp.]